MKRLSLLLVLFISLFPSSYATHLKGGEITYEADSSNPFRYMFTLTTYTDNIGGATANAAQTEVTFYFGDGSSEIAPRINGTGTPLENQTTVNYYQVSHTFPGNSIYSVNVGIQNRNAGVINIGPTPEQTSFFIQTILSINTADKNNSVQFKDKPIFLASLGQIYRQNILANDEEGDSLSFELVKSQEQSTDGNSGNNIPGYQFPDSLSIHPTSGEILWKPQMAGAYNFAIKISEWRHGALLGSIIRDYQVTVFDSSEPGPEVHLYQPQGQEMVSSKGMRVEVGDKIELKVILRANAADTIRWAAFGEAFQLGSQPTFTINDSLDYKVGKFSWVPSISDKRNQPYIVAFRGTAVFNQRSNLQSDLTVLLYVGVEAPNISPIHPVPLITAVEEELSMLPIIQVYPNPVIDQLHIRIQNKPMRLSLHLLNSTGQEVKQVENIREHDYVISLATLSSGLYFYRLVSGNKVLGSGKLVKQ